MEIKNLEVVLIPHQEKPVIISKSVFQALGPFEQLAARPSRDADPYRLLKKMLWNRLGEVLEEKGESPKKRSARSVRPGTTRRGVVPFRCKAGWGSGVVMTPLTCLKGSYVAEIR